MERVIFFKIRLYKVCFKLPFYKEKLSRSEGSLSMWCIWVRPRQMAKQDEIKSILRLAIQAIARGPGFAGFFVFIFLSLAA